MRKLIFQAMISLDGFVEGPRGELDWHLVDEEFNDYAAGLLHQTGTLLFGRRTYEMMADFWSTEASAKADPVIAERMNSLEKIVASRKLTSAYWQNSLIVRNDIGSCVRQLKEQPGQYITLFGSSQLAAHLSNEHLIDEYRLIITPTLLGAGKTLFTGSRKTLQLTDSYIFNSGNVLHYYTQKN